MRLRSTARTTGSDPVNVGSNPAVATKFMGAFSPAEANEIVQVISKHYDFDELMYAFMRRATREGNLDLAAKVYGLLWEIRRERILQRGIKI